MRTDVGTWSSTHGPSSHTTDAPGTARCGTTTVARIGVDRLPFRHSRRTSWRAEGVSSTNQDAVTSPKAGRSSVHESVTTGVPPPHGPEFRLTRCELVTSGVQ